MNLTFRYPNYLSYAIGAFDRHHKDPWFRGGHTEASPLGRGEKLKARRADMNSVRELLSEEDRIFHDHYDIDPSEASLQESRCPYCAGRIWLEIRKLTDKGRQYRSPIAESVLRSSGAVIQRCDLCHWWRLIKHFKDGICTDFDHTLWFTNFVYEGIVHEFREGNDRVIADIREQVQRREIDLCSISPTNLEKLVGAVIRDHLGQDVRHVGGPGDGGIDLIVAESDNPIAVQVKRRSDSGKVEPVAEVRHLLGAMVLEGYRHGIFATTAGRFSPAARKTVERSKRQLSVMIELYDHARLTELIQPSPTADQPWETVLGAPPSLIRRVVGWSSRLFQREP